MKKMQVMMEKLKKKSVTPRPAREPYRWKGGKTNHHATQCIERPLIICNGLFAIRMEIVRKAATANRQTGFF